MRKCTVMLKRFALVAALVMAAGWTAAFAGEGKAAKDITIGFSQDINDIEWTEKMRKEIQEACLEAGVKLTVTDAKGSGEKAASDIEDLITLGVDAIIIQTYHADVIANATRDALDAGIPVIALSSEIPGVEVTSLITVDAVAAGRMMGEWVVKHFPDGANIVQITGKEGSLVNQNRGIGFRQVINPNPKFTVLSELSANYERGKAMNIMEDQLQAHGDKIQVVYCHNDDMALGSIQAIEVMGYVADINKGICVVSPADGLYAEVLDMVEAEKMVSGYFPAFGYEGVATALRAINGEPVEKRIIVPSEPITKANVDKYR